MTDEDVVIDGLCAIRRFFEIGQPSQIITFDSYQNIIDSAIELIHDKQNQIAMLLIAQHELFEMMKKQGEQHV